MHQQIADATFRIECGRSSGSGFSFKKGDIAVTNHHVIEPALVSGQPIYAVAEDGTKLSARIISYSDKLQYDYAILQVVDQIPKNRAVLQPKAAADVARGTRILFSGFPHGVHDLLVHEAIISGPVQQHAFYIDGSVNGGNSGGPIVDHTTGELVGIVTQRRFLGVQSLQSLGQQVNQLSAQCAGMANRGTVQIMGLDFGQFASMMAQGLGAISQVIEANANSGIGIGFKMEFMHQECVKLGL